MKEVQFGKVCVRVKRGTILNEKVIFRVLHSVYDICNSYLDIKSAKFKYRHFHKCVIFTVITIVIFVNDPNHTNKDISLKLRNRLNPHICLKLLTQQLSI
jgi:hypothetical protein